MTESLQPLLHRSADDLHKTNAARKDAELQGLRKVVAAKEKSIDSLRAQLATSKASLEAYTQEAEAIMQQKDNEVEAADKLYACVLHNVPSKLHLMFACLLSHMLRAE